MSLFKKLSKKLKIKLPGGTVGKYGKVGKILGALAIGPVAGPVNPLSMDKDVLGAKGSISSPGLSTDKAKEYKFDAATAAASAATEASAQDAAQKAQEGQLAERQRRRRFAYGYNRASGGSGGLGGTGDAGGGQKTLLGY